MSRAVAKPTRRAATYEDLLAVPEPLVAEILFGQLVTHPRPAPRHAYVVTQLNGVLVPAFALGAGGPGGWVFLVEPELHLGEHIAVPDIAGWHLDRLPELPDTAWVETVPDWVCEVLSPSTERYDRSDKQTIYAGAGVGHRWQINPALTLLEVYELNGDKWLLLDVVHDDAQVALAPFSELSFPLDALWSPKPLSGEQKQRRVAPVKKRKRARRSPT